MKICGLQKVTLIDYPGKIACTLFLFGCNFRCGFCHNPELVLNNISSEKFEEKEILEYLASREKYLEGVCITGGEPLISLEETFLREIKKFGYSIKIDTNGSFPEKLEEFISNHLVDFVAMDVKNSPEKYFLTTGVNVDINKIEKSLKLISSLENYEFRTTVVEKLHNEEDILEIAKWLNKVIGKKPKRYILQGFKKENKLLDDKFLNVKNTGELFLEKIKDKIKDYFEEVEIRI